MDDEAAAVVPADVVVAAAVSAAAAVVGAVVVAVAPVAAESSAFLEASMLGALGVGLPPPPRATRRSSWVKLELRLDTSSPSNHVAPAALVGSCACCRIFVLLHIPWLLRVRTKRSCWTLPFVVPGLMLHRLGGHSSWSSPSEMRERMTSSH